MGKPKAPKPADPKVTASAQTATNIGTAVAQGNLNNVNQVTPYGNLSFDQTGSYKYSDPNSGEVHDIPRFTATQTLTEPQQRILDQENRASENLARLGADQSGRLNGLLNRPIDQDALPSGGSASDIGQPEFMRMGGGDYGAQRDRVEGALMGRLDKQIDRDRDRMEQRLADQGIRIGSEAYSESMGDMEQQNNEARTSALLAAGEEQSRLAGLEAQRVGVNNSAEGQGFNAGLSLFDASNNERSQALQQEFAIRQAPINEVTALMSGSQIGAPNFISPNTAQIANTDFAGLQANYDGQMMGRYNQQMQQRGQIFGGLAGMGGQVIAAL